MVRTDGQRAGGRCTVMWLPNFLGWVDLLTHGAPQACFTRQSSAINIDSITPANPQQIVIRGAETAEKHFWYSRQKNVLRKLPRIPYRRLKAGFSVCWLCLFVAGVLSEMHEVRTFAPCKALIFYLTSLLFFRRLKITLDSEQPMLKKKRIIPSARGGIKGFEHF